MKTRQTFFCGEIQNRRDLCAKLSVEADGLELLAALYAKKGAAGFAEIRGPFSACFKVGEVTVLVRDPMGVAWLYNWTKDPRI